MLSSYVIVSALIHIKCFDFLNYLKNVCVFGEMNSSVKGSYQQAQKLQVYLGSTILVEVSHHCGSHAKIDRIILCQQLTSPGRKGTRREWGTQAERSQNMTRSK